MSSEVQNSEVPNGNTLCSFTDFTGLCANASEEITVLSCPAQEGKLFFCFILPSNRAFVFGIVEWLDIGSQRQLYRVAE